MYVMCMSVYMCEYTHVSRLLRVCYRSPKADVTGGCEPPDTDTEMCFTGVISPDPKTAQRDVIQVSRSSKDVLALLRTLEEA